MIKILIRAIVTPFYREHAGFFMVLLFFAGGFMRAQEHVTIAQYIAKSDFLSIGLLFVFFLYHIKVVIFTRDLLQKRQYLFLRGFLLIPLFQQIVILGVIQIALSAIVIIYGAFVGKYMLGISAYYRLAMVLIYLLLSINLSSWLILKQIKQPILEQKNSFLTHFSNQRFKKPYTLWFLIHLIKNRPALFILSKILSMTLLIGCFSVYDTDTYDWRFIGVGTIFAMATNLMLAHEYFDFHSIKLAYFRNLPISIARRISKSIFTVFLLLLPEVIVIIRQIPNDVSFYFVIQIMVYGILTSLFYYHWMLFKNDTIEQLGKACFYFTILQSFLILFGVPLYLISLMMLGFILTIQMKYYSLHEY